MALKNHPNKITSKSTEEMQNANDNFRIIKEAYEYLPDPIRKELYDETLAKGKNTIQMANHLSKIVTHIRTRIAKNREKYRESYYYY